MTTDQHAANSEFELTPDGLLRSHGRVVDVIGIVDGPVPIGLMGTKDATDEAIRTFLRIAQTPPQTSNTAGPL